MFFLKDIFWGFIQRDVCSFLPTSALQTCSLSCWVTAASRFGTLLTVFSPIGDMSLPAAIPSTLLFCPLLRISAPVVQIIHVFMEGGESAEITAQGKPLREEKKVLVL